MRGDHLPGADQGQVHQVGLFQICFGGQRAVPAHQHPPDVPRGQGQGVVLRDVRRLDDDAEIQQPLIQPVGDVLGVAAVEVVADGRALGAHLPDHLGDGAEPPRLAAADVDIPADRVLQRGELGLGLVHHGHDLLGPAAQQHPFGGQVHPVALADQQGAAEFLLQVLHLAGEGGLGQVQKVGRPGDAALPGHGQEIAQGPYLHLFASSCIDILSPLYTLLPCLGSIF